MRPTPIISSGQLTTLRKQYEATMRPLTVLVNEHGDECLVILESPPTVDEGIKRYNCHRYFILAGKWIVSIDGDNVPLEAVFSWLNDPGAASTKPDEYVKPARASAM